jgi:hypothetical protein
MSAPPIAAVVVKPLIKLRTAFVPKKAAAIAGVAGAIVRNPAIVSAFAPKRELLTKCFPGSASGFDDIRPANFRNATIEPVKVIPPKILINTSSMSDRTSYQ